MKLRDRVSGGVVDRPPNAILFGQWVAEGDADSRSLDLNGFPLEDRDALVPDPMGRWIIGCPGDKPQANGQFYSNPLPDEQDIEAVLQLGGWLMEMPAAQNGWLEWYEKSPLAPGLEEAVKPHPLEDSIEEELHHLEQVCLKPRTHIRLETERVLVSRVRRVDPKAPMWLAAHTEDWEHRKISGVQPHRILAQVREEEWNIYENRVAVRLVDNLATWLRRRMSAVHRVLKDIFARLSDYQVSTAGTWHRLRRISALWGEAWKADQGKEIAERTIKRLDRLLHRVLQLMDSPLYRSVPKGAQVPLSLKMTNLLSNDDNYRGVANLWHEWFRLAAPKKVSPRQLHRRYQDLRHGLDAWCMLVLVRACSQLGIDPIDEHMEAPIAPGALPIRLSSMHDLQWDSDGTMRIMDGDQTCVRFVPLVHSLERTESAEAIERRITSIMDSAAANKTWTVILHLAMPGPAPYIQLAGVWDPPFPGTPGAVDFVRVSPFVLDSVERVARAVRWATLVPRMLAYPPVVVTPPPELISGVSPWLQKRDESRWVLVRSARPQELVRLDLESKLTEARADRDRLALQREQIDDNLQHALRDDRRQRRALEQQRQQLLKPLQKAENRVSRILEFKESFETGDRNLQELMRCPICREPGRFVDRNEDCFWVQCTRDSCESSLELRTNRESCQRVPILLPGGIKPESWLHKTQPQWVDDILGCDVLAVPEASKDGGVTFRPPRQTNLSEK
jgi:hypothetical protein